jgi:ATP-dependent HslUV protease ATP-binding subunit HslU
MAIYLGGEIKNTESKLKLDDLTPRQIVAELDKYVVGQTNAKRAVAVALRKPYTKAKTSARDCSRCIAEKYINDWFDRCRQNRNCAAACKTCQFSLYQIEASKITEVGYVGRDVESMIRELTDIAVDMTKQTAFEEVLQTAKDNVEEKFLVFYTQPQKHNIPIILIM